MDIAQLIRACSEPSAYPFAVDRVEVRQTHISAVFLAGPFAYKVKKPVRLDFLDFSTLEKRRTFCDEEVRLNRRLAPDVYLGVVPFTRDGAGLRMEGTGEAVEWAVKMARLPDEATLAARLRRGEVTSRDVDVLARRVAAFHEHAEAGPDVAAFAAFDAVARNARENFTTAAAPALPPDDFDRLRQLTEAALATQRPAIESRAARGVPRDGHGDLRLDHVYLFPDREPPADLAVLDCVEFGARFRCADPVADVAFLVMDLRAHGRDDLGRAFAEAYFRAAGDDEGRALLPFYASYRAAVRGKVEGLKAAEPEVPAAEREAAAAKARGFWRLALAQLEETGRDSCLPEGGPNRRP